MGLPTTSASKGLRLVEEREVKVVALRNHIQQSIDKGGAYSDDDMTTFLASE